MRALFLIFLFIASTSNAQLSNQYPTSPGTTTLNALPIWGDTTGGSLSNTSIKTDQSSITAAKPVTLQMPGTSVTTSGGTVQFPAFVSADAGLYVLMKSTNPILTNGTIGNYLSFTDQSGIGVPVAPTAALDQRLFAYYDDLQIVQSTGARVQATSWWRTVITFGTTPLTEKSFTITDANVKSLNNANTGLDYTIDAKIARDQVGTTKTYIDEFDMDSYYVGCTPGTGNFTCVVRCLTGQLTGQFNLDYKLQGQTL